MIVYAVVFGNYEPPEVEALYETGSEAERHAAADSGGLLRVIPWTVRKKYA